MAKISDQAVLEATGKSRDQWFEIIEAEEQGQWTHKQIVDFLGREFDISYWWQQNLAVDYEKAKGRRKTGETLESGFQIGVRKTIQCSANALQSLIFSNQGAELWLGKKSGFLAEKDFSGTTQEGIYFKVRVVSQNHLRLTYQPSQWKSPSILQIRIIESAKEKAVLAFHQEKLGSPAVRESMRSLWSETAERIKDHCEQEK